MLSYNDIINELGKNIFIYPMKDVVLKGASLDLTASKFAWSLKTKQSICKNNVIEIPPHDTAIIFTNEAIHVTGKIAGTYHSKVSFVSEGLGHIGTTLDPYYIGLSKLAIHNHSDMPFNLPVNHTIASVIFDYVKTPLKKQEQPDCTDFVVAMREFEGYDEFKSFVDSNNWIFHKDSLCEQVNLDASYIKYSKKREKTKTYVVSLLPHIISLFATIALFGCLYIFSPQEIKGSIPLYAVISCCAQLPSIFYAIYRK